MTHHTPQGLPPYIYGWEVGPNEKVWNEAAVREALAAQAATIEAICKIIECAGPEAADEIADLLGYPSVEWPSDQALTAPNLACKSAQARLATQWGYVRAASVEPVGKIINSGGNTGSLPEHPLLVWLGGVPPVGTELYASAPPSPASVQNASLVEKLAKRTCEANADSARFTIALQTLRASLDPDDWMGAVTMHNYIDAVLAGGSPLQQHPAPSPAQAVDAVSLRFRKKPVVIEASQWFKNGDHPLDYSRTHQGLENGQLRDFKPQERQANELEGDIVRYYRTPSLDGKQACKHCGKIMHEHGWIDTLEGGHIVCPGDWIITGVAGEHYPCKPDIFAKTYEPAALQAARQPQAQQGVAAPLELKVCHSQNASQTPQTDLSLMAAPQEWSPAYTRGPSRQSAPVTAVPAMVPLTEEQMVSAVRPLCNTDQVAERLVAVSIDEYRAIEAASAKLNGLTVGDGTAKAQPFDIRND